MMVDIIWHLLIGVVVSFAGSIPLGTINLGVVQTTVSVNLKAGLYFALGATLIELIYSTIAIKLIGVLMTQTHLDSIIRMVSVPVFLLVAVYYLKKEEKEGESRELKKGRSFLNGIFLGVINPLQIPFWVFWGSIFMSNKWIAKDDFLLNVFIAGICIGTILVLTLIAFLSHSIAARVNLKSQFVNKLIGYVLIVLGVYQLCDLIYKFI
ncbi:MAG: LysE family transporter [Sporocytophaga sp.]|uniref:LysE family translocator n=1 Tax=Sporocytophaga sp. TaxID=2231183 RepID=UPI001B152B78|nr:LysE family transporter [Sporocytophaga sp.]MBO9701913.1 LysE family transporter [Sporocytophaga sp.]